MPRRPEIGNIQLYPNRPLNSDDRNGYVLKFYCPIAKRRIRRNCGTRDARKARNILRERRTRLLNGESVLSGGAITAQHVTGVPAPRAAPSENVSLENVKSWQECCERYRNFKSTRIRSASVEDSMWRLHTAERIFENARERLGLSEGLAVQEVMTLEMLTYLQDRLLAGDESRYDQRSPMSVNSTMRAVMAFVRYCHKFGWIEQVPKLESLHVNEVMKGRPVTGDEFDCMIAATPAVVGHGAAPSWQFALRILWASGLRAGELMDFSWDDRSRIRPSWPSDGGMHPTIVLPSTQKNGKVQEIPMLPELAQLLQGVPDSQRSGWVVNPESMEYEIRNDKEWFQPRKEDLKKLMTEFSNSAIARACGVTETTVRNWRRRYSFPKGVHCPSGGRQIPSDRIETLRQTAVRRGDRPAQRRTDRLTTERVSRVIAMIGRTAEVVVQEADARTGRRVKFASAHDLRRGFAQRLINSGVSAETLKVVMRHSDFATTEKHYGALRSAQSASQELREKLSRETDSPSFVGGKEKAPQLNAEELRVLKSLVSKL